MLTSLQKDWKKLNLRDQLLSNIGLMISTGTISGAENGRPADSQNEGPGVGLEEGTPDFPEPPRLNPLPNLALASPRHMHPSEWWGPPPITQQHRAVLEERHLHCQRANCTKDGSPPGTTGQGDPSIVALTAKSAASPGL